MSTDSKFKLDVSVHKISVFTGQDSVEKQHLIPDNKTHKSQKQH